MWCARVLLLATYIGSLNGPALAIEGPAAAGPIGGTDIRSAVLPPPGFYGGIIFLAAETLNFVGAGGKTVPALKEAHLAKQLAGPFLYYVPDVKIFGGSIGLGGIVPVGNQCGHLFIRTPNECEPGVGDPYLEFDWSRAFGKLRKSKFAGAYPILQGLTLMAGFGVLFPAGTYDASDLTQQALSIGNNIWDFAPTIAVTYTTAPLLGEGTEISAKFYWNNYLRNPDTHYLTGDLLDLDFAVTERIGRFQIGATGFYAFQIEDDKLFGRPVPPGGRRAEILHLGGIVAFDMPERATSLKLKALTSVFAENTPTFWSIAFGFLRKF